MEKQLTYILNGKSGLLSGVSADDAIIKLARLEKLLQSGALVELPKIGDKVYFVDKFRINEVTVAYIVVDKIGATIYDYRLLPHRMGESCFLTKYEAKKATENRSE